MDRIVLGTLLVGFMGASQAEERDFFPLDVGNRWVFQQFDLRYQDTLQVADIVSIEVIDQIQLNELPYFVLRQDWNVFLPDTLFVRKEGARVFWYIDEPDSVALDFQGSRILDRNKTAWLAYDFEASPGTFWDLPLREQWGARSDLIIWRVFINARWEGDIGLQVEPSQKFFRFSSLGFVAEWDEVFEVGVGPVFITNFTTETEIGDFGRLKEAQIGNRTIIRDLSTPVEQTRWGQIKRP